MLVINEMFYSLQGEGTYTGRPSIFIRTSGCNLRCGYCDTPYTSINPEGTNTKISDIIKKIEKEWSDCHHIVITGGEPMINKKMPRLVDALKARNNFITVETNGTIFNPAVQPDLFSISPKTKNSNPAVNSEQGIQDRILHIKNNRLENSIPKFIESDIEYQIKFVVEGHSDLIEIDDFILKYGIENRNVFLMPEGITREVQRARELEIAEICKNRGFNFCPRLHIELWGTKRGV